MDCLTLNNPAVQQLAWACFSPPLIRVGDYQSDTDEIIDFHVLLTPERKEWLQELDSYPAPLLEWLASRNSQRLGIRFERLWSFFFQHDHNFAVLASNLPVRDKGSTLGEFDLLVEDRIDGETYHLELALKYYLQIPEPTQELDSYWIGPDGKDSLQRKVQHMIEHQLELGSTTAGTNVLVKAGTSEYRKAMIFRGWLFRSQYNSRPLPSVIADQEQVHTWMRLRDFIEDVSSAENWQLLNRSEWISARPDQFDSRTHNHATLLRDLEMEIQSTGRPQLLVLCEQEDGWIRPDRRLFVTPDNWLAGVT